MNSVTRAPSVPAAASGFGAVKSGVPWISQSSDQRGCWARIDGWLEIEVVANSFAMLER